MKEICEYKHFITPLSESPQRLSLQQFSSIFPDMPIFVLWHWTLPLRHYSIHAGMMSCVFESMTSFIQDANSYKIIHKSKKGNHFFILSSSINSSSLNRTNICFYTVLTGKLFFKSKTSTYNSAFKAHSCFLGLELYFNWWRQSIITGLGLYALRKVDFYFLIEAIHDHSVKCNAIQSKHVSIRMFSRLWFTMCASH